MDADIKRTIILDNYQDAKNRGVPLNADGYIKINSNNQSCIDNIDIYVKLKDNVIEDIKFEGEACVIAISSTSILSDMLIGKNIEEVKTILKNYYNMIEERDYDKELLGEACVYDDIYKQPSRKTCVTLFARGIENIVSKDK
ncbi:MAG: SUF system NifU family Fe-S cluster assembly protein [Bacilli bacterium]|nr:SUF system NifU family Fe-S cluster assembly protein [Bacilli bacterium]